MVAVIVWGVEKWVGARKNGDGACGNAGEERDTVGKTKLCCLDTPVILFMDKECCEVGLSVFQGMNVCSGILHNMLIGLKIGGK